MTISPDFEVLSSTIEAPFVKPWYRRRWRATAYINGGPATAVIWRTFKGRTREEAMDRARRWIEALR